MSFPFAEVRFPEDISYGSTGGPEYSTDIVTTHSGYEQRNVNWLQARVRYNVSHGVKTMAQLEALIAFFRARRGKAQGFRFKDWTDYQAVGQRLGIGDDLKTEFQLVKAYSSGSTSEIRTITKPVSGTVQVYAKGILQTSGVTVDTATGIVTFTNPPDAGDVITADYEFDVPVRFDTDHLAATLDTYGSHSWNNIPLVEIRF